MNMEWDQEKYLIALANIDVDRIVWRQSEEGIQYLAGLDALQLKEVE